jgi:hypothetical protein
MFETAVRDGVVMKPLRTWHAGELPSIWVGHKTISGRELGLLLSPTPPMVPGLPFSAKPRPPRMMERASLASGMKARSLEA